MANVLRASGPCENGVFYAKYLNVNPLFSRLFVSKVNHFPFNASWDSKITVTMSNLAYYGRALSLGNGRVDRNQVYAVMMADLLGPALNETCFIDTEVAARNEMVAAVRALIAHPGLASITTAPMDANYVQYVTADANAGLYEGALGAPIDEDINPQAAGWGFAHALRILRHIAVNAVKGYTFGGLGLIANTTVAVARRGSVSDSVIQKIESGIHDDLGQVVSLNAEAITIFYRVFGQSINSTNIIAIRERWDALIPGHALRLSLVVQQMSGSGLTSFITIGRAMRMYPTFRWASAGRSFPEEFINFMAAVRAVNGNAFYGFNKDLGPVKSTKYKNLSYIAKELLVKVGGEAALNRYAGWPRRCKDQAYVDTLIAEFEAGRVVGNDEDARVIEQGLAAIDEAMQLPANAALFA